MADKAVIPANSVQSFTPEQVELIKRTVAKGADNDELKLFLYLSAQYGLDPFKNEIWFLKYNNETKIITSRDGYLKIAQSHPDFIGLISFVVREGDEFEIDASNYTVKHRFGSKRGPIIGAWAKCEREGRNPVICFVDFAEYNGQSPVWKKYPSAMIQKVAEVFVLKRQFSISGLVTREELDMPISDSIGVTNDITNQAMQEFGGIESTKDERKDERPISEKQRARLFALSGGQEAVVRQVISEYGHESTKDVKRWEYDEICAKVERLAKEGVA